MVTRARPKAEGNFLHGNFLIEIARNHDEGDIVTGFRQELEGFLSTAQAGGDAPTAPWAS